MRVVLGRTNTPLYLSVSFIAPFFEEEPKNARESSLAFLLSVSGRDLKGAAVTLLKEVRPYGSPDFLQRLRGTYRRRNGGTLLRNKSVKPFMEP